MSSIRHFTDEQFSDGTTIDGDRLEKALQDLEDYINNVPDGDFENRWLQSQIVLKYLPWTAMGHLLAPICLFLICLCTTTLAP